MDIQKAKVYENTYKTWIAGWDARMRAESEAQETVSWLSLGICLSLKPDSWNWWKNVVWSYWRVSCIWSQKLSLSLSLSLFLCFHIVHTVKPPVINIFSSLCGIHCANTRPQQTQAKHCFAQKFAGISTVAAAKEMVLPSVCLSYAEKCVGEKTRNFSERNMKCAPPPFVQNSAPTSLFESKPAETTQPIRCRYGFFSLNCILV